MADDARPAELRGLLAEALYWHMTEADEARGCALRCGYDGPDRSEHLADHLLPVVSAWAEQHTARRAAEAWDEGYAAGDRDAYEAAQILEWNFRRMGDDECTPNPYRAALTPASEEKR